MLDVKYMYISCTDLIRLHPTRQRNCTVIVVCCRFVYQDKKKQDGNTVNVMRCAAKSLVHKTRHGGGSCTIVETDEEGSLIRLANRNRHKPVSRKYVVSVHEYVTLVL